MRQKLGSRAPRTATDLVPVLPVRDAVHFPLLVNTLHVLREPSLRAVRRSLDGNRQVLVLSQRDMALEDPTAKDLFEIGTLSEALQALPMPDAGLRVALRGLRRARATRIVNRNGSFWAEIEELHEGNPVGAEAEALMRGCVSLFATVVHLGKSVPAEALEPVVHTERPTELADTIAHHLPIRPGQKQELLEELDPLRRLERILVLLRREVQILELDKSIHSRVESELGNSQREFYLREQLRVIQEELRQHENRLGESEELADRINRAKMPEAVAEKALGELRRLDRTPSASSEALVLRNYVEYLTELPWAITTEDRLDVAEAARILERDHFGLQKVKDRVLEYLAVRQLTSSLRGPILCFVGPPGVGKTSIARSIASAMGRRFVRLALGGVRDEAEIRGHRRTYVGSMPGRIISGIKQAGARNPVFVLDEIDKLASSAQGDPTSALLEALDPEQNRRFSDHYIEVPFDLSGAMFIATANLIENVPAALRDRMEIISFPNYTDQEREQIARRFLFPKSLQEHGLSSSQVTVKPEAIRRLVGAYTREAGVRELERTIATVCRKSARLIAEGRPAKLVVDDAYLQQALGKPRFDRKLATTSEVGTAVGLVVGEAGGGIIAIEASLMPPLAQRPELRLTGSLGGVMKESAEAALTFVRSSQRMLGAAEPFHYDVHVHVPEGGVPKDGPSAGLTIAVALASAYSGRPVKARTAMTGEITLRGRVLPVGGVRDKLLAAHRAGITTVILPEDNLGDLDDLPAEARRDLRIVPISSLEAAFAAALV